jgi:hypothetical protein
MKKNTLFLSAAITTFALVLLGGVIKVVAGRIGKPAQAAAPSSSPTVQQIEPTLVLPTATPIPVDAGVITPSDAAFIAGSALGDTKIYAVDTVTRYGMDAYKVTFSSGNIVYVSPQGRILAISSLNTTIDQAATGQPSSLQASGGNIASQPQAGGGGSQSEDSHEAESEHSDDGPGD